jgi:hypothetical protein
MTPKPIPAAIEKVSGTPAMMRKAGKADESERDQAFDDHARHRDRPGDLLRDDDVEGDDGVDAEPRGERHRHVGEAERIAGLTKTM